MKLFHRPNIKPSTMKFHNTIALLKSMSSTHQHQNTDNVRPSPYDSIRFYMHDLHIESSIKALSIHVQCRQIWQRFWFWIFEFSNFPPIVFTLESAHALLCKVRHCVILLSFEAFGSLMVFVLTNSGLWMDLV